MKKFSFLAASILLMVSLPFFSHVLAQESAMEAAESQCVAKAEEMNISDDKFDDFVEKCIQEMMSSK